ncbi:MAG: Rpn family recombination-promoting nuclease/putative transposase [bacterium]|nr:Rpn family recombination-promoting nuclease/putative transposase [bacterium]
MTVTNPHDTFIKKALSDFENALDFFRSVVPEEIKKNLHLSTLKLDGNSYVDEKLKECFSDIVFTCMYKGKILIRISLLIEHKSYYVSYPRIQVLKYMVGIWEHDIAAKGEKLKPVIPIVIYHGTEKWNNRPLWEYFEGIDNNLKRFVPDFDQVLVDLSDYSDEEIKNRLFQRASLKTAFLLMKNIFDTEKLEKNLVDYLEICRLYFKEEKGLKFLESIILYLYYTGNFEPKDIEDKIKQVSYMGGKKAMSTAERLIERGKVEGIEKGKIIDSQELLIKFLKTRFGDSFTDKDKELINSTEDHQKLRAALESILSATGKEEVLEKLT